MILTRSRSSQKRPVQHIAAALLAAVVCIVALIPAGPAAADPATFQKLEWWLSALQMQKVWTISQGSGVTVAVLDTGVDPSVGDLHGAVLRGYDMTGQGGDGRQDYGKPENPHGTDMAVNIAGRGTGTGYLGIAPKAKILPVQIDFNINGGLPKYTTAAINKIADLPHPPAIMNLSSAAPTTCSPEDQAAILRAIGRGIIVVAGAGNSNEAGNPGESPANCVGVVAVGAYDKSVKPWAKSERQPYVALAAPGVDVPHSVSKPGYQDYGDGTSDATSMVSGMLALLRAHFPKLSPRDLVTRLLATTHHIGPGPDRNSDGSKNRNTVAGYGAALPYQALTAKVPANAPNPIYDAVDAVEKNDPGSTAPSGGSTPGSRPPASGISAPSTAAAAPTIHDDSSSTGIVVLVVVVVALILIAILTLVVVRRRRRV